VTPSIHAVLDALGDPTRRAMVSLLARGPITVSALSEPLGVTVTAVGQHLRLLERAGLAASEKRGRARYCRLRPESLRDLEHWAQQCRAEWEARFDRLGAVLDDMDPGAAPPLVR
jgi:DNA-binding transcriptional ArsR family regulator